MDSRTLANQPMPQEVVMQLLLRFGQLTWVNIFAQDSHARPPLTENSYDPLANWTVRQTGEV